MRRNTNYYRNLPGQSRTKQVAQGRRTSEPEQSLAGRTREISQNLFASVILPTLRELVLEFGTTGLRMMIYGDGISTDRGGHRRRTSYHRSYERYGRSEPRRAAPAEEVYEDVFFDSRLDAEMVLGRLMEMIEEYGRVTVGDLYSLCGLPTTHTSQRYGWTRIHGVEIANTRDGWVIELPSPTYFR